MQRGHDEDAELTNPLEVALLQLGQLLDVAAALLRPIPLLLVAVKGGLDLRLSDVESLFGELDDLAGAVRRRGGHGVDGEGEEEEDVEEQHDEVDVTAEPVPLVSGEKRLHEYAMNINIDYDTRSRTRALPRAPTFTCTGLKNLFVCGYLTYVSL